MAGGVGWLGGRVGTVGGFGAVTTSLVAGGAAMTPPEATDMTGPLSSASTSRKIALDPGSAVRRIRMKAAGARLK